MNIKLIFTSFVCFFIAIATIAQANTDEYHYDFYIENLRFIDQIEGASEKNIIAADICLYENITTTLIFPMKLTLSLEGRRVNMKNIDFVSHKKNGKNDRCMITVFDDLPVVDKKKHHIKLALSFEKTNTEKNKDNNIFSDKIMIDPYIYTDRSRVTVQEIKTIEELKKDGELYKITVKLINRGKKEWKYEGDQIVLRLFPEYDSQYRGSMGSCVLDTPKNMNLRYLQTDTVSCVFETHSALEKYFLDSFYLRGKLNYKYFEKEVSSVFFNTKPSIISFIKYDFFAGAGFPPELLHKKIEVQQAKGDQISVVVPVASTKDLYSGPVEVSFSMGEKSVTKEVFLTKGNQSYVIFDLWDQVDHSTGEVRRVFHPDLLPGKDFSFELTVDPNKKIYESDEWNNINKHTLTMPIDMVDPFDSFTADLKIMSIEFDPSGKINGAKGKNALVFQVCDKEKTRKKVDFFATVKINPSTKRKARWVKKYDTSEPLYTDSRFLSFSGLEDDNCEEFSLPLHFFQYDTANYPVEISITPSSGKSEKGFSNNVKQELLYLNIEESGETAPQINTFIAQQNGDVLEISWDTQNTYQCDESVLQWHPTSLKKGTENEFFETSGSVVYQPPQSGVYEIGLHCWNQNAQVVKTSKKIDFQNTHSSKTLNLLAPKNTNTPVSEVIGADRERNKWVVLPDIETVQISLQMPTEGVFSKKSRFLHRIPQGVNAYNISLPKNAECRVKNRNEKTYILCNGLPLGSKIIYDVDSSNISSGMVSFPTRIKYYDKENNMKVFKDRIIIKN